MIEQTNQNHITNSNNPQEKNNDNLVKLSWKEITFENLLNIKEQKKYKEYHNPKCCYGSGLIGIICKAITLISISIVFVITSFFFLINNNKSYIKYKDIIESDQLSSFDKFWCNIGKYENGILISYFIILLLTLTFEIVSLLILKHKIKIKIGSGITYKIIIFINFIFYIIINVYNILLLYLFSIIIAAVIDNPLKMREYPTILNEKINVSNIISNNATITREETEIKQNWDDQIIINVVYIIIIFIIFCLSNICELFYDSIIYYLNFDFNDLNDNIPKEEKIISTTLFLNDKFYNIKIKNKKKYVKLYINYNNQINSLRGLHLLLFIYFRNSNLYIPFKEILIEDHTTSFIYINSVNKYVNNQLSIIDWEYPKFNEFFEYIKSLFLNIFAFLMLSIEFFQLHITNEENYYVLLNYILEGIIEEPKYYNILKIYGNFEKNAADTRFSLYLICSIVSGIFFLKRIYFGGKEFGKYYIQISYALSILLILLNIIFMIITIFIIVFSGICHETLLNLSRDDYILRKKILLQCIFNSIFFINLIVILVFNIKILKYLKEIMNDKEKLKKSNGEIENKNSFLYEIKYKDLYDRDCILKEKRLNNFPKFIFYELDSPNNNNNNNNEVQQNINQIPEETNINNNENNLETNVGNDIGNNIINTSDRFKINNQEKK